MADQIPLHRSAEIEDLSHLSKEEMNKPLTPTGKSDRALIVVDIQNDYFPQGRWTLAGIEQAADNAAKLLASARSAGDLIVFIRHEFPTADAPFFAPGSAGAQIHPKVENHPHEIVITKNQINAFRDTNLKEVLDRHSIHQLVICGAMSHMCIDAVTRAATDYGYNCTLIHDACASKDLEFNGKVIPAEHVHAAYMAALGFAYAKAISTEEFLSKKHI
jgi:nicotinamidase-related amidase